MTQAIRTLRRSMILVSTALLLGLWLAPASAEAAPGERKRASSSVGRKAVPRATAPSRTPATRHSSKSSGAWGYRGPRHSYGYRVGFGLGYSGYRGFGYYGYYPYGWGYWPIYYPYAYGYPYAYPYRRAWAATEQVGAFDLNVKPKKAQVYVDGVLVGKAARFDGYPSYLWVSKGRHELVFYMPGYRTVAQEVTALPGTVIDVRLRLEAGESRPPEEVMTYRLPPPREEQRVAAAEPPLVDRPLPERQSSGAREIDLRGEPGRFQVSVEPGDASVYLDGRFLGTGNELARLHSGLIVDPGTHQLEVVRPGYRSRTVEFEVEAGEDVELNLALETAGG